MGMYDEAKSMVNADSGDYIKFQSGKKTRLRVLDHPYVSTKQFQAGGELKTRFTWPVWDYEAGKVRLLEQGPMIFGQIADVVAIYGEDMPMACDLVIGKTGEDLNTKYNTVAAPIDTRLPEDIHTQLPALAEVVKGGVPMQQYVKGTKPTPQGADGQDDYQPEQVPVDAYDQEVPAH